MKNLRAILFVVVALIQIAAPGSVIWKRMQTLKNGRVWKFKTAPVDPVDAVRGRYIALRFAAEEVHQFDRMTSNQSGYAVLKEDKEGFAEIDHVSATRVSGDDVLKVEPVNWWRDTQRVRFPFDRFWVAEQNAVAADKAYAENSRKGNENAYATVRVRNGDAAIEELYIDDQPLRDYLRAHPPK
jgi:uncharacterized membrane-anchored protein